MDPISYILISGAMQAVTQLMGRGPQRDALEQRERFHEWQVETEEQRGRAAVEARKQDQADKLALQKQDHSHDFKRRLWPIAFSPDSFDAHAERHPEIPIVLFAPPNIGEASMLHRQIKDSCELWMREMINFGYAPNDPLRPVRWIEGLLKDAPRGLQALETLYAHNPNVPTALIQLDYINHMLHLSVGVYGFDRFNKQLLPTMSEVGRISLIDASAEAIRSEIKRLEPALPTLAAPGKDLSRFGINAANLDVYLTEKSTNSQHDSLYRPDQNHVLAGIRIMGPALQLTTAMLADFFHWSRREISPLLPALVPNIAAAFPEEMRLALNREIFKHYDTVYATRALALPRLEGAAQLLRLAETYLNEDCGIMDRAQAEILLDSAMRKLLETRGIQSSLLDYAMRDEALIDVELLALFIPVWNGLGKDTDASALARGIANLSARRAEKMAVPFDSLVAALNQTVQKGAAL